MENSTLLQRGKYMKKQYELFFSTGESVRGEGCSLTEVANRIIVPSVRKLVRYTENGRVYEVVRQTGCHCHYHHGQDLPCEHDLARIGL